MAQGSDTQSQSPPLDQVTNGQSVTPLGMYGGEKANEAPQDAEASEGGATAEDEHTACGEAGEPAASEVTTEIAAVGDGETVPAEKVAGERALARRTSFLIAAAPRGLHRAVRFSEADKVEDELAEAQRLLPIQDHPALRERLTKRERSAEQRAARKVREADRKERLASDLAEVQRKARQRRLETKLADQQHSDQLWARKAEATRQRLTAPASRLARLHQARRIVLAALGVPAVAGIAAGAINVQGVIAAHFNLAPTALMWWMGYFIEPLLTLPLAGILIYQAATAGPNRKATWRNGPLVWVEVALLIVAVLLNTAPHISNGADALIWSIPPIMICTTLVLLPTIADGLNNQLLEAQTEAELVAPAGRIEGESAKLLRQVVQVRQLDADGAIGGERDEDGLPSTTKIRSALRISKEDAAKVKDALRVLTTSERKG